MKKKMARSVNYKVEEDIVLCDSWMNISLDARVESIKPKKSFGRGFKEYCASRVTITSNRT